MYVDDIVPNTFRHGCKCCGCEDENSCCCDFISNLNGSYWAAIAHNLHFTITDKECCNGSSPCANGKLDGISGCLTPTTQNTEPDFCIKYWRLQPTLSLLSECGTVAPINLGLQLYCQTGNLGINDPAINSSYGCSKGFRWRLRVTMSNSACDVVPDPINGGQDTDVSTSAFSSILYHPFAGLYHEEKINPPICEPTGTCPPNLGKFEVAFRVEAPHNNESGSVCNCCNPGNHYIVKIKLDQSKCPTAIGAGIC